jgi:hypothetical protein
MDRLFPLSTRDEAENLRTELRERRWLSPNKLEAIGILLARDCAGQAWEHWDCEQLAHCASERRRAALALAPILFPE